MNNLKVVAIVGPTASGKTKTAVELAREFDGEVISADSRQVYRGLHIGTEKVTKEEMQDIPHHLIDVCDPQEVFSVQSFMDQGHEAIQEISARKHVPIVAGGTGFYVEALLYDTTMPPVPPNAPLRAKLEKQSTEELYAQIEQHDPERAASIDPHNKRRLIRALEIIDALGKVPKEQEKSLHYDALQIGLQVPDDVLRERISARLDQALLNGLLQETLKLLEDVPHERMHEFGLEYRVALEVIDGVLPAAAMKEKMQHALFKYAKRQHTWFRRNDDIEWFLFDDTKAIIERVAAFLNKKTAA